MGQPKKTPGELFWSKVDKSDGCWLWTGGKCGPGYGNVKAMGRWWMAHQVAYALLIEPCPDGMELDHLCRVRHCVNPAHLEPVTSAENTRRGLRFVAATAATLAAKQDGLAKCRQGHALAGANLHVESSGRRRCVVCRREQTKRWAHRQVAA